MRAAVKDFLTFDFDRSAPLSNPSDAGFLVQMLVGPADGPGEESFQVMVCTPAWLERYVDRIGPLIGRHYLIVQDFDWPRVRTFLQQAVETCEAELWHDLAEQIGRIGKWEFEDYRSESDWRGRG